MAVDGQGGEAQAAEQEDRGAGLRADAGERLEPGPRLGHGQVGQEVERQVAPRRSVIARRISWSRGAFCSGQVHGAIASSTSCVAASRTAAQSGNRDGVA
jgi:hypothetical protein